MMSGWEGWGRCRRGYRGDAGGGVESGKGRGGSREGRRGERELGG